MSLSPSTQQDAAPEGAPDLGELFDHGPSPVEGGADFACSWSGETSGQIIIRGKVLHVNAGEQSAAIPAERLQGWTTREHEDHVELIIESNENLHVLIPSGLFLAVEKAMQGLR